MNCLDRRLELLKMEGLGMNKSEVVKELTQKFQCSRQLIYYDYDTRVKWQPTLQDLDAKKLMLKIYNRAEYIYRKASYMLITSQNENAQIGALKTMLAANQQFIELAVPQGTQPDSDKSLLAVSLSYRMKPTEDLLKDYEEAIKRATDLDVSVMLNRRFNNDVFSNEEQEILVKASELLRRETNKTPEGMH